MTCFLLYFTGNLATFNHRLSQNVINLFIYSLIIAFCLNNSSVFPYSDVDSELGNPSYLASMVELKETSVNTFPILDN